ncbi:hypothetical protein HRbin31_00286 [bacterium HR31]|nr:hypothetical protein HRbin31_00286 [bacterium HR31]
MRVVSTPTRSPKTSRRVTRAMITSSRAALPARSPMPLMVPSTCRAPACTPARELATAIPRSSWQCTLQTTRSESGTRSRTVRMRFAYSWGTAYPTVSGRLITAAPSRMAASTTRHRNSTSERVASSQLNSTSGHRERASRTACRAASSTSSGLIRSLRSMWMGEVAMKVWIRGRSASRTPSQHTSMSWRCARARPQITGPRTSRAISRTASRSPGDAMGNPASITSTPRRARARAISSFSCTVMEKPGDCSPSRRVVSKM